MKARNAYLSSMIQTASSTSLLLMLLDRLRLDVEQAVEHQQTGDHQAASVRLLHAQEIMSQLQSTLDTDRCPGGDDLAAVYDFIFRGLVDANVRRDVVVTRDCLTLVVQVVELWHETATVAAGAAASA